MIKRKSDPAPDGQGCLSPRLTRFSRRILLLAAAPLSVAGLLLSQRRQRHQRQQQIRWIGHL